MATDTQTIKDRLDIVQIVGEYVPLKKSGANWKANCPFHHEKSPSFMVHPEKQIWHCFGCGKGGDVISFVQEMEGLDFVETLKLLARRAGVEINFSHTDGDPSLRNRLMEINTAAANFFHQFLLKMPAAENARAYLENRKLKQQTILDWQIGFIPDQWELLTQYLSKKGFKLEDLVSAGLTIKRDNADPQTGRGYYDRFRGRVMFPICDTHGNVIGFTGRVLVETENSGGKYVNTPETLLYEKSKVLYGIHRAKTEIKSKDQVILVEGQMDVIACHQAGMTNVVAASGTALTIEQIKLLKRYTNNIAMAFDADAAGQKAGKRGIEVAMEEGMNIRVIKIPDGAGKDADECLKKDPKVWFEAVKNASQIMDWYFATVLKGVNRNDYTAKQKATSVLLDEIVRIKNGVERDEWLKKLGEELMIEMSVLREEIKKVKVKPTQIHGKEEKVPVTPKAVSPYDSLCDRFWSLVLKHPKSYASLATLIKKEYFVETAYNTLYETAFALYTKENKLDIDNLRINLPLTDGAPTVDLLLLRPEEVDENDTTKELENILHRIHEKWRELKGRELQKKLSDAERSKDKDQILKIMTELQNLK